MTNKPSTLTFEEYCEIFVDHLHWKELEDKLKREPDKWKSLKTSPVSLEYQSSAMPPSRGGIRHCDAILSKEQISWIWNVHDENKAIHRESSSYRRLVLQHLNWSKTDNVLCPKYFRAFTLRDEISISRQDSPNINSVGDDSSVLVGPGHQLVLYELIPRVNSARKDVSTQLLFRRDLKHIRGVPSDLLRYYDPNMLVRFVDLQSVGQYGDWALAFETPCPAALGDEAQRPPAIYHPRHCTDVDISKYVVSSGGQRAPFANLPLLPIVNTASKHLAQYLLNGPRTRFDTSVPRDSGLVLLPAVPERSDAPGSRNERTRQGGAVAAATGPALSAVRSPGHPACEAKREAVLKYLAIACAVVCVSVLVRFVQFCTFHKILTFIFDNMPPSFLNYGRPPQLQNRAASACQCRAAAGASLGPGRPRRAEVREPRSRRRR
jgi:hypothetical protein